MIGFFARRSKAPLVLCVFAAGWAIRCGGEASVPDSVGPPSSTSSQWFVEVTADVGLPVPSAPWHDGTHFVPEITAAGVALFDADSDGDLDLLQLRVPPPGRPDEPAPDVFWRQGGDGRFNDATEESGLGNAGFSQGVAVGDIDADGALDVYLANFGPDRLYRNAGDGRFVDVTRDAGIAGDHWSSSATFCDADGDGDLDLYVAHYLRYMPNTVCLGDDGTREYCGPGSFDGVPDRLYLNDGAGRFSDGTRRAGVLPRAGGKFAKGLGVVCTDLTGDGLPDFYVANDGEANDLWVNRGDGTFAEEAMLRGVAVNRYGNPESSMGVAVSDVDRDGLLDLFMTHLVGQNNTLYKGGRMKLFTDATAEAKMASDDFALTGFGCALVDFDHDADPDLVVANGRVYRGPVLSGASRVGRFWSYYAEPNQLYVNDGAGGFDSGAARARELTGPVEVTRGLAVGDLDGDGDMDLVVSNNDNTLRVYRNAAPAEGAHWLRLRVRGGGVDAQGAQLTLRAGDRAWTGVMLPGSSYASSSEPVAHFGLGDFAGPVRVDVRWPDGGVERFDVEGVDRTIVLDRGGGTRR